MRTKERIEKKLARCLQIVAFFYTSGLVTCKLAGLVEKYGVCTRTIERDLEHLSAAGFVLERYREGDETWLRRML